MTSRKALRESSRSACAVTRTPTGDAARIASGSTSASVPTAAPTNLAMLLVIQSIAQHWGPFCVRLHLSIPCLQEGIGIGRSTMNTTTS